MGTTKTRMTEEEFLRLPDDGRKYELVAGAPKEVPASIRYDIIGMTVRALLRPAANGMGYVVGPQAGWRVRSSNIRCPRVFRVRGTVCVAYVSGKPDRKSLHIPYRVKSVWPARRNQWWPATPRFPLCCLRTLCISEGEHYLLDEGWSHSSSVVGLSSSLRNAPVCVPVGVFRHSLLPLPEGLHGEEVL